MDKGWPEGISAGNRAAQPTSSSFAVASLVVGLPSVTSAPDHTFRRFKDSFCPARTNGVAVDSQLGTSRRGTSGEGPGGWKKRGQPLWLGGLVGSRVEPLWFRTYFNRRPTTRRRPRLKPCLAILLCILTAERTRCLAVQAPQSAAGRPHLTHWGPPRLSLTRGFARRLVVD